MKKIWERIVPLAKADREWDVRFWQAQSASMRFKTAWEMLEDFYKLRGKKINARSFRLQRAAENLKQA